MTPILNNRLAIYSVNAQPKFTCLKSTIETLEQCMKLFKIINKDTRTKSVIVFWWFHC